MSQEQIVSVNCPKCNCEADFTTYKTINTVLTPSLKEKIRNNELFLFRCPRCGHVTNFDYDFLYTQDEDKLMIYYATTDASYFDALTMLVGSEKDKDVKTLDDYTIRVVNSRFHLREKLVIFDNGLDDRTVELAKLVLATKFKDEHSDVKFDQILFDTRGVEFGFSVFSKGVLQGFFSMPMSLYNEVDADYRPMYTNKKQENLSIGLGWAISMVKLANNVFD